MGLTFKHIAGSFNASFRQVFQQMFKQGLEGFWARAEARFGQGLRFLCGIFDGCMNFHRFYLHSSILDIFLGYFCQYFVNNSIY